MMLDGDDKDVLDLTVSSSQLEARSLGKWKSKLQTNEKQIDAKLRRDLVECCSPTFSFSCSVSIWTLQAASIDRRLLLAPASPPAEAARHRSVDRGTTARPPRPRHAPQGHRLATLTCRGPGFLSGLGRACTRGDGQSGTTTAADRTRFIVD